MTNGHAPATKQDVEEAVSGLRNELLAAMRASEMKLLQALYGYAESNRLRLSQQEVEMASLMTRLGVLEDRLLLLEKRLNLVEPTQ
ncbi:hypothetical protein SBA6_350020 [Candidatus Sulfopaludibacter sp. SbA6]|nr:hypothetical protein SBA6_350020 [Candidatus Sulfopaludibacter sp. SbA6]